MDKYSNNTSANIILCNENEYVYAIFTRDLSKALKLQMDKVIIYKENERYKNFQKMDCHDGIGAGGFNELLKDHKFFDFISKEEMELTKTISHL